MTWVPPYLGSYEHLVQELLGNPFLGSGHGRPHVTHLESRTAAPPDAGQPAYGPIPDPWRGAAANLIFKVSLKELGVRLPKEQAGGFVAGLEQSIADDIDYYCGNGLHPWPHPWGLVIASELSLYANTLQEGDLQNALGNVATTMVKRSLSGQSQARAKGAEAAA